MMTMMTMTRRIINRKMIFSKEEMILVISKMAITMGL